MDHDHLVEREYQLSTPSTGQRSRDHHNRRSPPASCVDTRLHVHQSTPRYLLSHAFWDAYLERRPESLNDEERILCEAATGFLRTYRYFIRHESDFHLTQQDSLRLIPKDVGWASFCQFTSELNHFKDAVVSGRCYFGELRQTRLNFYAPLLLRKFHFEQVHGQYGDYLARLYGPVLFVFAVVSTILNCKDCMITRHSTRAQATNG
jgi:hypothetical protein